MCIAGQKRQRLHLDSAVAAVPNLTQSFSSSLGPAFTKAEVQELVAYQTQQVLLAARAPTSSRPPTLGSGSGIAGSNINRVYRRFKRQTKDNDVEEVCFDCGSQNHRRGDPSWECLSYLTGRIRSRDKSFSRKSEDTVNKGLFSIFRKGSGSGSSRSC